jgi:hypothetical protein
MATYTRATIKVIMQHRQEYQDQYCREEKPNSLVDVAWEPRIRITIIEELAFGTNIARITLLAATRRKNPKPIWQSKIWKIIPIKL